MIGYKLIDLLLGLEWTNVQSVEKLMKELTSSQNEALAAHELARQLMASRSKKRFILFKKGNKIWLEAKNLNLGHYTRKMASKYERPFVIADILKLVTYKLKLLQQ